MLAPNRVVLAPPAGTYGAAAATAGAPLRTSRKARSRPTGSAGAPVPRAAVREECPMSATRRPTTRRKVVAITVAALGIAGLGLASAAQLNVTPNSLGAGTSVVASCDTDSVKIAFGTSFSAANKGYVVDTVKLTGVAASCAGQAVTVDLLDANPESGTGAALGSYTATVPTTGTGDRDVTVTRTGGTTAIKASAVLGAAVVITGATGA